MLELLCIRKLCVRLMKQLNGLDISLFLWTSQRVIWSFFGFFGTFPKYGQNIEPAQFSRELRAKNSQLSRAYFMSAQQRKWGGIKIMEKPYIYNIYGIIRAESKRTVPCKLSSNSPHVFAATSHKLQHLTSQSFHNIWNSFLQHINRNTVVKLEIGYMRCICEQLCDKAGYFHALSQYQKSNCRPKRIGTWKNTLSK